MRLVNSVGMKFAHIPSGTFLMGSPDDEPERKTDQADEGPLHPVTISQPFYYGIYPVTQREYETVMGENPSHFGETNGGGPDHPVEMVSWAQAKEFCWNLSSRPEEAGAGRVYRLPSEAEWEYACRAGTTTPFWWGNSATSLDANFDGRNPYNDGTPSGFLERTAAVGSYRPNPFGLYDVHGNVWEWCADWYDEHYYGVSPAVDPPGSDRDGRPATRGGSWYDWGSRSRSAHRDFWYGAAYSSDKIGFRVVLTIPAADTTGGLPASFAPPPE
jgi:formylglycine-generating enzyme required for sulfatase activity